MKLIMSSSTVPTLLPKLDKALEMEQILPFDMYVF